MKSRELLLCRGTGRCVCTDVHKQFIPVLLGNGENWSRKTVTQRQVGRRG